MMTSTQFDIYCSPKSPRAVVDFGLLQVDEDKLLENLDVLRTPPLFLDTASDDSTSVPPLQALSICSSSGAKNDDSSSVSSVSLDGEISSWDNPNATRCIFSSYWKKVGGKPACPVPTRSARDEDLLKTDLSSSDHSYEHLLEKNEAAASRRDSDTSVGSRRRRLWDNHYVSQSEPALTQCIKTFRKTQSCSAVQGPKQSCLRKGRFSSGERRSSDSSVSFNEMIQVKYLKPVTENWAPRGWSKYFA